MLGYLHPVPNAAIKLSFMGLAMKRCKVYGAGWSMLTYYAQFRGLFLPLILPYSVRIYEAMDLNDSETILRRSGRRERYF